MSRGNVKPGFRPSDDFGKVPAGKPEPCLKTIWITGATGFLGTALIHKFAAFGRVVGTGFVHDPGGVDLRDADAVGRHLDQIQPHLVIHAAAYRDPDYCEQHPEETRRLNVDPVRVLAARLSPASQLVLISTDYVFDGEAPPYDEDRPRQPLNVYGRSKVEAEDLALARAHSLVVRIPLLIGVEPAYRGPAGFVLQLVRLVLDPNPADVDDLLVRYPTWTADVAEAIAHLWLRDAEGVFHVSAPIGRTRYAWARETARVLGRSAAHLRPSQIPARHPARRPRDAGLATEKLQATGFHGFTDFEPVVRRVLAAHPSAAPGRGQSQ